MSRVMVFLAHWCPNCQDEVPEIQQWLEDNGTPDRVELWSVATASGAVGAARFEALVEAARRAPPSS